MLEITVTRIFFIIGIYLSVGVAISLWLLVRKVGMLDEAANHTGIGFRLLLVPGLTIFWPLFLRRSLRGDRQPPEEHNAHRRLARLQGRRS